MRSTFDRPIRIETDRCILSEMQVNDAVYWYRFMTNPRISKYLPETIASLSEMEQILKWLTSNYEVDPDKVARVTLSVGLKSNAAAAVGWITYGTLPEDENLKEIGYAIEPAFWGRGIATEAARGFMPWIAQQITVDRLYATVDSENSPSVRVLKKLGMHRLPVVNKESLQALPGHDLYVIDRAALLRRRS